MTDRYILDGDSIIDTESNKTHSLESICILLNQLSFKKEKCFNELNILKHTIVSTLNDEIKDCELLLSVDEDDLYVQGRLIEINNLMNMLIRLVEL